jgi:hypothetical protein
VLARALTHSVPWEASKDPTVVRSGRELGEIHVRERQVVFYAPCLARDNPERTTWLIDQIYDENGMFGMSKRCLVSDHYERVVRGRDLHDLFDARAVVRWVTQLSI